MTVECFIQVLENAYWRLGGVPEVAVFDNGSCAVKHADCYDAELHPKIIDFCKHYGFALVPTLPRTPRHKGKIERGIGYVKSNAFKGTIFESLAAQNEHLAQWESTVADTRIHGTTKKQVGLWFEQHARSSLQPLPRERFPYYEEGRRKVSRDGHIAMKHAFYSVPPEYLVMRSRFDGIVSYFGFSMIAWKPLPLIALNSQEDLVLSTNTLFLKRSMELRRECNIS